MEYLDILKQYWGYSSFRGIQQDIIESIGNGKDTLGLMPTGGGKSITFQVPTMAMEGVCLVITPLIALMKDQVRNLRDRGIKAAAIYTGMRRDQIIATMENCVYGNYKFLYISPERLSSELFLAKLRFINVCLITVDESHCISQWGYDFRPAYLNIAEMGHGIFGVEAASQKYFNRSASKLTTHQAVSIACVLPNPLKRNPKTVSKTNSSKYNTTYKRTQQTAYPFD